MALKTSAFKRSRLYFFLICVHVLFSIFPIGQILNNRPCLVKTLLSFREQIEQKE